MDKNIKVALGCFGSAIFIAGGIIGSLIQERIDRKANKNCADLNVKLLKTYHSEFERVHKENEQLKIRIFSKQR